MISVLTDKKNCFLVIKNWVYLWLFPQVEAIVFRTSSWFVSVCSVCLSVCLTACLSVCLSVCTSACLLAALLPVLSQRKLRLVTCFFTGTWAVWHTAALQRLCVWWVISLVWVIVTVRISCLMPHVEIVFMWTSTACSKRSVVLLLDKRRLGPRRKGNTSIWSDENVSHDTRCKWLGEI